MKKVIIFLGGVTVGFFIGYGVAKKRTEDECENIISDIRRKSKDDIKKLKEKFNESDKKDNITEFKKFKSLEEDDKLKEILGKKTSVLTESEYDYLRSKKWDYGVVEFHTDSDEFTNTDGTPFTKFEENDIFDEAKEAVLNAPYDVGAFICIKNNGEKKVYEAVRIDDEGLDSEDEDTPDDTDSGITPGETPNDPEFITEEEYSEEELTFSKVKVNYYMDEDEYIDEENFIIDNPDKLFPKFNPKEGAEYYVRNYELETDYFITVIPSKSDGESS